MLSEEQERRAMRGFDYVMQSFKIMHLNKLDKGARMLTNSNLQAYVQKNEATRLEIMMRFTKYSIKELKHLFNAIDVEAEAKRILAKQCQNQAVI
ncbi:MAG: hypothetical protein NTV32_10585 [Gammaproteobacteria bacterium]|nr:hypothetical protein [Gammaproteobacteria bacterium]